MSFKEWQRILRHVRVHASGLALILLLTLAGVALDALLPWPMKLIIDHVLAPAHLPDTVTWIGRLPGVTGPSSLLAWLAASTVLLFAVRRVLAIAQSWMQAGVGSRMVYGIAQELFESLQRLSLRFHSRQRSGDLVRRVLTDSDALRSLVFGVAIPAFSSLASLVTMLAILWQLDRSMTALALLALPPVLLLTRSFRGPLTRRAEEQQRIESELSSTAEQSLSAVIALQTFSREAEQTDRFRETSRRALRAYQRVTVGDLGFKLAVQGVTALATASMMLLGGLHVLEGTLTVGGLNIFLVYLASLYAPLETLAQLTAGVATARAKASRINEALASEEFVRDAAGARTLAVSARAPLGEVKLDHVEFGYEPGTPVLRGIDLHVEAGETVALVGPTGGGKSTLLALVPRLFDPWRGSVSVGGVDARDVTLRSLREQISIVLQEPFLLPLTVAENIAYGRPDAGTEAIVAAAEAAQADGFIRALPMGYETRLGERGVDLSGGQRQRLAIARAILKDAPILLLDEPTAALDVETEAKLLTAIEHLRRGRTTLVIAHRLSTARNADRVIVLDRGRIIEQGQPAELLAAGGRYRELYERQFNSTPSPRGTPGAS